MLHPLSGNTMDVNRRACKRLYTFQHIPNAHNATLETVDFEILTEFWSKKISLSCDELWHLLGFADQENYEIWGIDCFIMKRMSVVSGQWKRIEIVCKPFSWRGICIWTVDTIRHKMKKGNIKWHFFFYFYTISRRIFLVKKIERAVIIQLILCLFYKNTTKR